MDQAAVQKARIPELEAIETLPIFFAINDGQHCQSVMILEKLREFYPEGNGSQPDPRCLLYKDTEEAVAKAPRNAVMIFDDEKGKNCFSLLYRAKQPCSTLWGVAVSRQLKSERIARVVNQLKADFDKKFFERLNEGKLPWGDKASSENSRKRRQLQRKRFYRRGFQGDRYSYY